MKKHISKLLILAMLLSLAACGETEKPVDTADTGETTTELPEDTSVHDDLPESLDFGGETLRIFCTDYEDTESYNFMHREEADGDIVNDAIFNRNRNTAERLNLNTEWTKYFFDYGTRNEMYTAVRTSVMGGDDAYDIVCVPTYFNSTLMAEGLMSDLKELPHVNFDKPYWFSSFTEQATINGKQYMAAGDGLLCYIGGLYCLAFNKNMAEDYKLNDLYSLVYDGKWTIDRMNDIVKTLYSDLNGNTTVDADDSYGLELRTSNYIMGFMGGCEMDPIVKTKDGYEFAFDNERCVDIYDKVFAILHESSNACFLDGSYRDRPAEAPFVCGRALFAGMTFKDTMHYRDLDFDYGILPYPKLDEEQTDYHTRSASGTPVFLVPVTSAGSEKVGAFLEALSSEAYKTTTPAYFETALKVKYSSGDEMSDMFDIVKNSEYMSYGSMLAAEIGAPEDTFRGNVSNSANSGNWASTAAGKKTATMEKLANFLDKLAENE